MNPRFQLGCCLCFGLWLCLDGWTLDEGSASQRETRYQEFMHLEQHRLDEAEKNYLAAVATAGRLEVGDIRYAARLNRPAPTEPDLRVRVLVYNYAQVPAQRLANAAKRARMTFRTAGVELLLIYYTPTESLSRKRSLDDIDLILRILPQPRVTLASQKALGEALPCGWTREGCLASVFYNRIQETSDLHEISSDEVLGHAIAHELGHLLLGSNSHAATGLMKNNWRRNDLRRAAKGDLLFTPEQSEILRRNVLSRITVKEILTGSPSATPTANAPL